MSGATVEPWAVSARGCASANPASTPRRGAKTCLFVPVFGQRDRGELRRWVDTDRCGVKGHQMRASHAAAANDAVTEPVVIGIDHRVRAK
jgi:hypothetical protein